jgi:NADH:ubiquinone oxidoreductase subunit C
MNMTINLSRIKIEFPTAALSEVSGLTQVSVDKGQIRPLLIFLKEGLCFDFLVFSSAIDRMAEKKIEAIYLLSCGNKIRLMVRAVLAREKPEIDSVSDIYRSADWHERETAEMFGIHFTGHPDMRPLLLPDDFKGFPLRKDFEDADMLPLPSGKNN